MKSGNKNIRVGFISHFKLLSCGTISIIIFKTLAYVKTKLYLYGISIHIDELFNQGATIGDLLAGDERSVL